MVESTRRVLALKPPNKHTWSFEYRIALIDMFNYIINRVYWLSIATLYSQFPSDIQLQHQLVQAEVFSSDGLELWLTNDTMELVDSHSDSCFACFCQRHYSSRQTEFMGCHGWWCKAIRLKFRRWFLREKVSTALLPSRGTFIDLWHSHSFLTFYCCFFCRRCLNTQNIFSFESSLQPETWPTLKTTRVTRTIVLQSAAYRLYLQTRK